jgi:hypothetical protein
MSKGVQAPIRQWAELVNEESSRAALESSACEHVRREGRQVIVLWCPDYTSCKARQAGASDMAGTRCDWCRTPGARRNLLRVESTTRAGSAALPRGPNLAMPSLARPRGSLPSAFQVKATEVRVTGITLGNAWGPAKLMPGISEG